MRPELEATVNELRSHEFKVKLLIECYSDVKDADVDALRTVGHEAGFDVIETTYFSWPSPESSQSPQ